MGHFVCNKNKIIIYDAPKTGGSTLRFWINYYIKGKNSNIYNYQDSYQNNYSRLAKTSNYKLVKFKKYSNSYRKICIYRNPIERFVSCYNDKIIKENRWKNIPFMNDPFDLDSFFKGLNSQKKTLKWQLKSLLGLNNGYWKNYINFHFETLTYHYGKNISYFDDIFDIKEINLNLKPYLEKIWNIDLPDAHMRNSKLSDNNYLPKLSNRDINKIMSFYKEDYQNGWDKIEIN